MCGRRIGFGGSNFGGSSFDRGGALSLKVAEVGQGITPIALCRLLTPEQFLEGVGAGRVIVERGTEGIGRGLGASDQRVDHLDFDTGEAALVPVRADDGVEQRGFDGADRVELGVIVKTEFLELGRIFSGDDEGGGIGTVFPGIEAGSGLALDGAWAGRKLSVGAIGTDLSRCCHTPSEYLPNVRDPAVEGGKCLKRWKKYFDIGCHPTSAQWGLLSNWHGVEICQILEHHGFLSVRQYGSHRIM